MGKGKPRFKRRKDKDEKAEGTKAPEAGQRDGMPLMGPDKASVKAWKKTLDLVLRAEESGDLQEAATLLCEAQTVFEKSHMRRFRSGRLDFNEWQLSDLLNHMMGVCRYGERVPKHWTFERSVVPTIECAKILLEPLANAPTAPRRRPGGKSVNGREQGEQRK